MAEVVDFNKIPLEDRVVHKVWKARVNGYEECAKHFKDIDDPKGNEYTKYIGLLKKFVVDSNAVAQEKGLDAVLTFVEFASPAISGSKPSSKKARLTLTTDELVVSDDDEIDDTEDFDDSDYLDEGEYEAEEADQ